MVTLIDAIINSAAVWFVLKAVEVLPFLIYDVVHSIKRCWKRRSELYPRENMSSAMQYETKRGKLEYLFSGDGFLDYTVFRKSKKWFLISTLVPIVIFMLELSTIFLGLETRTCETSSDPHVVRAPSLQLFRKGGQKISTEVVNLGIITSARKLRPCFTEQSTHFGVDYLASICIDHRATAVPVIIKNEFRPNDKYVMVMILTEQDSTPNFALMVFSRPLNTTFENSTAIGILLFQSEVLVGGKSVLYSDTISGATVDENFRRELLTDFREMEKTVTEDPNSFGYTTSQYLEGDGFFGFQWDSEEGYVLGLFPLIVALLAQSKSTGLRTAAELSERNLNYTEFQNFEVSCQEDFTLSWKISAAIIVVASLVRIAIMIIPRSMSSAEFALGFCEETENDKRSTVFFMDKQKSAHNIDIPT